MLCLHAIKKLEQTSVVETSPPGLFSWLVETSLPRVLPNWRAGSGLIRAAERSE
jgi:hypothetical protein